MGYDYIAFDDHHFKEDLQYERRRPHVPPSDGSWPGSEGLEFGVKLTNTFPVDVTAGELPSEEMYMAGKSPVPPDHRHGRRMLSREFDGKLRISYSGGADIFNIDRLFACGIWPITMATTDAQARRLPALQPDRRECWTCCTTRPSTGVDVEAIDALALSGPSRTSTIIEAHQAPAQPEAATRRCP